MPSRSWHPKPRCCCRPWCAATRHPRNNPGLRAFGAASGATPSPRAGPILAAAEEQQAALDAQHIGAQQDDVPGIGLAVLGIVDFAVPAIAAGGLHPDDDLRAHDRAITLARVGIVLVQPGLR